MKNSLWKYVPLEQGVNILDTVRQPINRKERMKRIENKEILYPYYGATGQVDYIDDYLLDGEYVLLGEDGAPFLNPLENKAYIVNGKFWVNNHAHILQSKTNNKFLCYYLNTVNYKELVTGTTRYKLTQAAMKRVNVPVPPLPEQERIVAHIEELFSELDAGVETLKKAKAQLDVYRQAVLKEAFEGIKTHIPLQDISCRIFDGPFGSNLKTADYITSGVPVVRLENIKSMMFDDSKKSFVSKEKYDSISSHTVYPSDLIMSTFMTDKIKVCQLPKSIKFAINKADCVGIRLNNQYDPKYVMYYLSSKEPYYFLSNKIHGATRPRVNLKQIKTIPIPICSTETQQQLSQNIESSLSVCNNIEQTIDAALEQAKALRHSILKEAFEKGG